MSFIQNPMGIGFGAVIEGKINNLSATASNGKYVLTAVKEGDQTTYAWESIDRSKSENKAQ